VNPDSRKGFQARAKIIQSIRCFLDDHDFLEVETPILQAAASGASARPFVTRHNALGEDFYLRISPETYLQRVVGDSLERVYELGRNFELDYRTEIARRAGIDLTVVRDLPTLQEQVARLGLMSRMRCPMRGWSICCTRRRSGPNS
jgi:elongation factor P--beta-lysine ligase